MPVLIRGQIWGNLYLTEKRGGEEFDTVDEESVVILAAWAAIAIENARLYEAVAARRDELEQSARRVEAAHAIAVAVGAEMELEQVLELIAKRGRALVEARSLVILLREGADLVVAASAGVTELATGARVPINASTTGQVLQTGPSSASRTSARTCGSPPRRSASPTRAPRCSCRSCIAGAASACSPRSIAAPARWFSADDEMTLRAFAASGATAVVLAQTVQQERLRHSLEAAEAERRRWARELHDETLQGLGGLRVHAVVGAAAGRGRAMAPTCCATASAEVEREIENLRAIITELRPAALDELGLVPAIEALVARMSTVEGLTIECALTLPGDERRCRRSSRRRSTASCRRR